MKADCMIFKTSAYLILLCYDAETCFYCSKEHNSLRICCFYLVCGVAVPNNEFAILGSADQKPDEKKETIMVQNSPFKSEKMFCEMRLITYLLDRKIWWLSLKQGRNCSAFYPAVSYNWE